MKKLFLSIVGLYIIFLHAFSQSSQAADSATYTSKPLKLDEINLVSSYYSQTGNHSAVTGGIGNERVTDLANGLSLTFVGWDGQGQKHSIVAGLGIDHHTAASQAFVSKSGASKTGGSRVYPSIDWTVENAAKGYSFGAGAYYSGEYNYHSFGFDLNYAKKTNNNGEFSVKANAFLDKVTLIYPSELVPGSTVTDNGGGDVTYTTASGRTVSLSGGGGHERNIPTSPRTTVSGTFSFAQVINKRLQGSISFDVVGQSGYLGLPFHRVYFTSGTDAVESLPSSRFKLPVGLRLNYFLGDNVILRSYYRYYIDDWGIKSQTASLEVPVKITPFFSVAPFYRYYTQTASTYFAPYGKHLETETYYTSNYAYAALNSGYFGFNVRIAPPKGIFYSSFSAMEIRYGHYTQTTDLLSNVVSFEFKFK